MMDVEERSKSLITESLIEETVRDDAINSRRNY